MRPAALMVPLGLLAAACGSTATALRADAAVDAPAADAPTSPATCRAWASNGPLVVISDPAADARFELLDAVATPDGALVAWRERGAVGQRDGVRVRRVGDDGAAHPWSAAGHTSRDAVVTLPTGDALQFSMVWDGPRDGVAMLAGGATDGGACVFARYAGDGAQARQGVDLAALMGFSLSGCGSLARTRDGYSFLTGEVRALWGDEVVFLADDGRIAGSTVVLPKTAIPTDGPMTRSPVTDGFVATWTQLAAGVRQLHARRYAADGAPRGDDQVLADGTAAFADARVVETADGLLAVWKIPGGTSPTSGATATRHLDATAAPLGDAALYAPRFATTAVHAAARGADVLVATTAPGALVPHLVFLALSSRGALRAPPLELLLAPSPVAVGPVRVVPTRRGALLVFGLANVGEVGRVVALPIDCLP